VGLITAGFDAIAMAMCNLLRSFIEHPEQWLLLEQNHGLINPAVEEGLRHLHPNKVMYRIAAGHTFIHGVELRPGDNILVWLGSANRDEEIFKDPDTFNIRREQPIRHIGFGAGIHACIGAALSRLEVQSMLQVLLELRLDFRQAEEDWWEPAVCPMMFGPDACNITLHGNK
jgi:cytochrome P450